MKGYIYLSFAIFLELAGTIYLKQSVGFSKFLPSAATILFYSAAFFSLSKALNFISLGTAYATWSGLGIVAAMLLSVFLFKESINAASVAGISLILIGSLLLNVYGSAH